MPISRKKEDFEQFIHNISMKSKTNVINMRKFDNELMAHFLVITPTTLKNFKLIMESWGLIRCHGTTIEILKDPLI